MSWALFSEELNEPSVGGGAGGGGRFEGLADVNESELLAIKGIQSLGAYGGFLHRVKIHGLLAFF